MPLTRTTDLSDPREKGRNAGELQELPNTSEQRHNGIPNMYNKFPFEKKEEGKLPRV